MAAGCGAFVHQDLLPPSECPHEPTVTGLVLYGGPGKRRAVWQGFACSAHAAHLRGARPLLPRDRGLLAARRDARRTELAGRRWAGEREGPLARGREADELLARAEAWAERYVSE